MPRVAVPVTQITRAGVAAPAEANGDPVNNHTVPNNGKMFLEVRNSGSTVARTVTFRFPGSIDGQPVTPRAVSIPISSTRRFGPFPTGDYGSALQVDVDNAELKLLAFGL